MLMLIVGPKHANASCAQPGFLPAAASDKMYAPSAGLAPPRKGVTRIKTAMSTGAGSGGQALLTGCELAIARNAPAVALQAVSVHRTSLSLSRKCHESDERCHKRDAATHFNLL
jgi:hypothetical protein